MKLQFGLLWIEDSYSRQEENEIVTGAADAGFELKITNSKDGNDLVDLAEYQRKYHAFDLVLLDLKLAGGVRGDKLAPLVRQHFRTTPILFYSGSDTELGLRERMAKDKIEGVFCATRGNFTQVASDLIKDYSHTLNRLAGMRGLAMEVVAEVDTICRAAIFAMADAGLEADAIKSLDKAVSDQSKKTLEVFPQLASLRDRMDHPAADSMKTFNTFRLMVKRYAKKMPNGEDRDSLQALILEIRDFREKVIHVRNVLGHALEERSETGWQILDRDGEPYMTVDDFPEYRSSFLRHLRAMKEISAILVP